MRFKTIPGGTYPNKTHHSPTIPIMSNISKKLTECPRGQWKRVDVDGTVTVTLGIPTLDEMREAIGCSLTDSVLIRNPVHGRWEGVVMLVDDQGVAKGLPINTAADAIYQKQIEADNTTHHMRLPEGYSGHILGVVVVCNDNDFALSNPIDE